MLHALHACQISCIVWQFISHNVVFPLSPSTLRSKGIYNRVRQVVDVRDTYYLAVEAHYCPAPGCGGTYLSSDHRLLSQLADGIRGRFPVLISHKSAVDRAVPMLMRDRTPGNSPTALRQAVTELHSQEYAFRLQAYLSDCKRHQ